MSEQDCPTCGPTTVEQHPRQPVTRCGNCKEWLTSVPPTQPPAAPERECRYPCDCGQFPDEHCACMDGHAPPAVAASTGTSEDVETLAMVLVTHRLHSSMNICTGCDWRATAGAGSLADQHASHLASLLAAREAAARAEERERIAQAIEAKVVHIHRSDYDRDGCDDGCGWLTFAARTAREAR
jgi:hypothetical protein